MVVACNQAELGVNAREQQARAEWRRVCFVLEGVQATHILAESRDKFAVARIYATFQAEESRMLAELSAAISQGNFRFFIDRGVSPSLLSESFARQLLRDWRAAIASKQSRIATAFERRFGEDIDVFSATPRNVEKIVESTCDEQSNALALLSRWTASHAPIV